MPEAAEPTAPVVAAGVGSGTVCAVDGVALAQARNGRLVHIDKLPKNTPEHEPQPVPRDELQVAIAGQLDLRGAVLDMLTHHAQLCPHSACDFALNLERLVPPSA
jgi:hypothetical protein